MGLKPAYPHIMSEIEVTPYGREAIQRTYFVGLDVGSNYKGTFQMPRNTNIVAEIEFLDEQDGQIISGFGVKPKGDSFELYGTFFMKKEAPEKIDLKKALGL